MPGALRAVPGGRFEGRVLLSIVILGALAGWIAYCLSGRAPDDIYISYRYARNLAEGKGFAFNPGERVFGLSDPGVAVLLAAGHALTGISIPVLGSILTGAALLAIAAILLTEAARRGFFWEGLGGGTLLVTSSYLWFAQGSGPLVALALLVAAGCLVAHQPWLAGVLGGFAVWCRPDALLGCCVILLLMRKDRGRCLRFGAAAAGVVAAGVLAAWIYFGVPLPETLAVKQDFGALNPEQFLGWSGFWKRALGLFVWFEGDRTRVLLVLGLVGTAFLFRALGLVGRLLVTYAAVSVLFYGIVRVSFAAWYVTVPVVVVLVSSSFAAGAVARWLNRRFPGKPFVGAGVAMVLYLFAAVPAFAATLHTVREPAAKDWRRVAYRAVGEWLAAHSPPDADVAFDEVGILGFYSDRRILDLIGLVSPATRPYSAVNDQLGAFLQHPTTYVVFHTFGARGGTRPVVSRPWFAHAYKEVARFNYPELGGAAVLFERRPGARIPPSRPPRKKRAAS